MKYILIVGNIVDGINPVGPFDNPEQATDYAELNFRLHDWLVTEIEAPLGIADMGRYDDEDGVTEEP